MLDKNVSWQVLQLHSAAEQFVELTEMLLVDAPERTDEGFQSEKRVRAGLRFTLNYALAGLIT